MNVEHLLNQLEGFVHHLPHGVQGPLNDVIETVRHIYETTVIAITPHEPVYDGKNSLASHHQKLQELHTQLSNNTSAFQLVYQGAGADSYHAVASTSLVHLNTTLDHISFASQQHETMGSQFGDARTSQLLLITMLGLVVITLASIPATVGLDSEIAVPAAVGEVAGAGGIIAAVMTALEGAGAAIAALEVDSLTIGMLAFTAGTLLDRPLTLDPPSDTPINQPPDKPPVNPDPSNLLKVIVSILGVGGATKIAEILADAVKKEELISALKKAYPECEGIIDWEKFLEAHPTWSLDDMTNYLKALQDAQNLMDTIGSLDPNIYKGSNGWRGRVKPQLDNLLKLLYNSNAKSEQVIGAQNNIKGAWYEIFLAMHFNQAGTLSISGMNASGDGKDIDVDLVLDEGDGPIWAEVKHQGPLTPGSRERWSEFESMVESRFKVAQANGIKEFDFYFYNEQNKFTQEQRDLINKWSKETGVKTKIVTDIKPGTIPSGSAWCQNTRTPKPPKPKTPAPPTVPTPTPPTSQPPAVQPPIQPPTSTPTPKN